jgi:ABC-type sugar transport system ATPase subunit
MKNIKKSFYGNPVLRNVNFGVRKGEVHVLLGENGAGKSTLMKILSGSYALDSGDIFLEGNTVTINEPAHSLKLGIGMVYQELSLIPQMSVLENIYLGNLPKNKMGLVDWKKAKTETKKILAQLGLDIDILKPVSSFDLGVQQLVEIVRVISQNVKLIILDEPTSSLTDTEIRKLFEAIRLLKTKNVSFIYITHKLNEVFEIGDRVTVLRDGSTVGMTIDDLAKTNYDKLVAMMVGRTLEEQYPKEYAKQDEVMLEVINMSDEHSFYDISFSVSKGEVLGVAGLVGAGRSELAKAIYGLHKYKKGKLYFNGKEFQPKNPAYSIKRGIGMITKDRKDGLLLHMPVYTNICIAAFKMFSKFGFRNKKKEISKSFKYIDLLKIDTDSPIKKVRDLSGGNQQKIAIAKWNCIDASLYIMDDPTRGVDVGAKVEVYKLINHITSQGAAVILISSDMPELLSMSDRIMVMRKGKMAVLMDVDQCTQEIILKHAAGSVEK